VDVIAYFERQLQALEELKSSAAPAQLDFYAQTELEIRGYLEQEIRDQSNPSPVTSEILQARIGRSVVYLQALEFQVGNPEYGEHWMRWAQKEIDLVKPRIENLTTTFKASFPDAQLVVPAPKDVSQFEFERAKKRVAIEVSELEMLKGLSLAWMENSNLTQDALVKEKRRLAELDERLGQAKMRLKSLDQAPSELASKA
jgi:hypothetical protein